MKLWLLTQEDNTGYDTYDSVVVAAETAEKAQRIHPSGKLYVEGGTSFSDWGYAYGTWAKRPDNVVVKYLGEAVEGTESGVVLASFNAG